MSLNIENNMSFGVPYCKNHAHLSVDASVKLSFHSFLNIFFIISIKKGEQDDR